MFVPHDMSESSFSDCRVSQGDGLKSLSFTGFRHSENIMSRSWRTHIGFQLSLRWHVQLVTPPVPLICLVPWKLIVCRFFATCSCHVEQLLMSIIQIWVGSPFKCRQSGVASEICFHLLHPDTGLLLL